MSSFLWAHLQVAGQTLFNLVGLLVESSVSMEPCVDSCSDKDHRQTESGERVGPEHVLISKRGELERVKVLSS